MCSSDLTIERPDGSYTATSQLSDPVWGGLVRTPDSMTSAIPSGLQRATTLTATATLGNPSDPLTLLSRSIDAAVNGRHYHATFDRSQLRWSFTTPAGRTSYLDVDPAGRPLSSGIGNLEPVHYTYDAGGRLTSMTQGTGSAERTVAFSYDGAGRLSSLTDPLSRVVDFSY